MCVSLCLLEGAISAIALSGVKKSGNFRNGGLLFYKVYVIFFVPFVTNGVFTEKE